MRMRVALVLAVVALVAAPAAAQIFTDMTNNPARRSAERLAAMGIIVRLPDGRLAPDEPLARLDVAVFLARAIGLPAAGVPYLEFKDVDQIPAGDRAAVAAAATMGTVSAQKAQVRKGNMIYTLSANKTVYTPDDRIELTFTFASDNAVPTELLSYDRGGKVRVKLTEREGAKVGYEGELYVESKTPQGTKREYVARILIKALGADGATADVVSTGNVEMKAGLKLVYLQDVWFEYSSSQLHDFIVRDFEGNEIARWSLNRAFYAMNTPALPLAGGHEFKESTTWRQLDQNDKPVRPGRYELIAMHTTKENPTTVSISYQRGMIAAYPDNTFRPKQPVTRAELAVFLVRALGLETEAVRRAADPLQVSDARDIPADARGAVVVALEKKAMLPFPDNTFRPARTATRGDAVMGFNAVMEAMGRYNYTTGTLREIRGGPPPVVVIEDASKSIRPLRVAVVSAIYRNDQPVVLLQLRAGDQLKMLKPTDAGEITYIEATGR